jgi:hypothetical protein
MLRFTLNRGHNVGDASKQLGNSSIKITFDVYRHLTPGKFKNEVDVLMVRRNRTQPRRNQGGHGYFFLSISKSFSWMLSKEPFDMMRRTSRCRTWARMKRSMASTSRK